ncbi:kinase-like domain-containing protein [Thamnocephalis sphaerospora]|uniref:Kinase-like domain-containing protein n=1 Tax=Thamnocephalis sphaerospora TaxID=78915 RepID=A0A4P9XU63_9FUNG|nr:kinase-like domain-containing protein [Thamnocephalis sphaerospora]|eukprot:RKP09755.1 kinase-like domain-containing protein [Thamnocephalis sphaerospora]
MRKDGMRTAVVAYDGVSGLLKCTPHANQHDNEVNALNTIKKSYIDDYEDSPFAKKKHDLTVPEILTTFKTNDGYHCLITEIFRGFSLREYMPLVSDDLKDAFTAHYVNSIARAIDSLHTKGFTHGNITPDTVYLQPQGKFDDLRVILTDFEGSQVIPEELRIWIGGQESQSPLPSIIKPRGYCPPEDYTEPKVDQRMRDSWMFGATLYYMTNGHSPYGDAYIESFKAMFPVPAEELQKTMEQVARTGKNSFPPMKTKNSALLKEAMRLMEPRPQNRADIRDLALKDVSDFRHFVDKYYGVAWDYLKSNLPIVGTPSWDVEPPEYERVEDTTTRYKRP